MKKIVFGIMLIMLLVSIMTLTLNIQTATASLPVHNVDTGEDFLTIQAAIDAPETLDGHTIYVEDGHYYEQVKVYKSLKLIGENRYNTIIDAEGKGTVVHVTAGNVNISEFTIQNSGQGLFDGMGVLLDGDMVVFEGHSHGNIIENNIIQYNERDILVWYSNNNTIRNNVLRYSTEGYTLYVWYATGNNIVNNYIYHRGIGLVQSGGNTFRNNVMAQFAVSGWSLNDYLNDVDISNEVSGKPIYYWVNEHNRQVPADAGVVVVVNSTCIIAIDLTFVNVGDGMIFAYTNDSLITNIASQRASYGIRLDFSNNNTVKGNRVSDNMLGIFLSHSENNSVTGNTAKGNSWAGIFLGSSNGNDIHNNIMQSNGDTGMSLEMSRDNTIAQNTIAYNGFQGDYYPAGMSFFNSPNNTIYHNNFVENIMQVSRHSGEAVASINSWDDGYPSGGNYWSDYEDKYPDAKEIDDSGIWDTPYVIDEQNQDRYPLMKPYVPLLGDFDEDRDIDEYDVWIFCAYFITYHKYGFRPEMRLFDFNNNSKIDENDLWTFCAAFIDYWKHH